MRRAIQELQTLEDASTPEAEPEPEPEPEDEEDPEDQKAIIEMLLKKRDELLRMQVRGFAKSRTADACAACACAASSVDACSVPLRSAFR